MKFNVNICTAQFVRHLYSDQDVWSDLNSIMDKEWLSQHEFESAMEHLDDEIKSCANDEDFNPYSLDFMCEVDLNQVADFIIYGRVSNYNGPITHLSDILDPDFGTMEEGKKAMLLAGTRIGGRSNFRVLDYVDLDARQEPGKAEMATRLDDLGKLVDGILEKAAGAMEVMK